MRSRFDEQLELLKKEMISMGMLCETSIASVVDALLNQDKKKLREVFELLELISAKDREVENICFRLLLQQQPVAKDLRTVSSALKMVTDMERIGVQSADIADIVSTGVISKVEEDIPMREIAESTIYMVTKSIDAFVYQDSELAEAVIESDNIVDDYFSQIKTNLIKYLVNPVADGERILDLLMIAKYFERIGDHAVNIAEWVIFSITGKNERINSI